MPRYVVLLRAINVGGSGLLPMVDLRAMLEKAGYGMVKTFGASGNVTLEATAKSSGEVAKKVGALVTARLKKPYPAFARSAAEMGAAVAASPFTKEESHFFVTFLAAPAKAALPTKTPRGDLKIVKTSGREVYSVALEVGGRFGNPNAFVENALKVEATTRNWRVVRQLAAAVG